MRNLTPPRFISAAILSLALLALTATHAAAQVRTASGLVEGRMSADGTVRIFEGIPYATPRRPSAIFAGSRRSPFLLGMA